MRADDLWYENAIFYELHVRAFADADGIGDFRGAAVVASTRPTACKVIGRGLARKSQ